MHMCTRIFLLFSNYYCTLPVKVFSKFFMFLFHTSKQMYEINYFIDNTYGNTAEEIIQVEWLNKKFIKTYSKKECLALLLI